jgi:hypothetical protein
VLVKGLPRDAITRIPVPERGREPWDPYMELLAQIVEVVSVGAANMRLKKPVKIPRPNRDEPLITSSSRRTAPAEDENPYASAINRLASVQPERYLHVVPDEDDEGQDPA